VSLRQSFEYSETYPRQRGHLDPAVGACKVASLRRWLQELRVDLTRKTVFEVGYGGGWCLAEASRFADQVFGLEVVRENATHAESLGLPGGHLYAPETLPHTLPEQIDVWFYLDAFEHLSDPVSHLAWVAANSTPEAQLLLVLPEAGSLSDRLLGPAWPHRLPDHTFHWSRRGLSEVLTRCGFSHIQWFSPTKRVSPRTLLAHALHKAGFSLSPPNSLDGVSFWWNLGEQGLLAARR
jgi:hypothetical protein